MSMQVAIIGGNLQGVEATYLAKKAGWQVLVIDKDPQAGASLMCDRFLPLTITADTDPHEILKDVDLIITVTAPEYIRIKRIIDRDQLNKEQIKTRITNQINEEERMNRSDFIVINDDKQLILPQIIRIHKKIIKFKKRVI